MKSIRPTFICRAALMVALWLGHPLRATAVCELSLDAVEANSRGGTGGEYNAFDENEHIQVIAFRVKHTGDACSYFVTFSGSGAESFRRRLTAGSESLEYQLYGNISRRVVLKDLQAASSSDLLAGHFSAGEQTRELTYVLAIPARQVRRPGQFSDTVKVALHEGTLNNARERDSKLVTIGTRVAPVSELSVGDAGAAFQRPASGHKIDFGNFRSKNSRRFEVRTRSNTGYQLTLTSENGGLLKNIDPSLTDSLPYVLKINGRITAFAGNADVTVAQSRRPTDVTGDRHNFEVIVNPTPGLLAGTYRDTIRVSIIAGE